MADYHEIEHTADVSFRVEGGNLRELLEKAARAMLHLQGPCTGPEPIIRNFSSKGDDCETLLVNCLNEILYLQDVHQETYCDFRIKVISETSLQAEVLGQQNSRPGKLIKAVTFHNLKIEPASGGLQATIVMDV